ncbi:MAG: hypothetical protein NUW22_05025 [Acidobacteria bacterium]|nr:hypothetical protein [Acidobacteriota bacterium]
MTRDEMATACEDVAVGAVVEDVNVHLFAAADELRKTCAWAVDDDGIYHTGCGHAWFFDTGTPAENQQQFCGYCGGALETKQEGQ